MSILLIEEVQEVQYLVEETKAGKQHYIQGIYLQTEKLNRNNRWYPFDTVAKEVSRYNKNYIKENRAWGELGHPDHPSINLDRVSHRIVDLHPDGKNFVGKARLLDTPLGKIAKTLIDDGGKLGVSTRGVGSLKKHPQGYQLVQDDFMLSTAADLVADPSAPDAFVQGIMEQRDWIFNAKSGEWSYRNAEQLREELRQATVNEIEDRKLALFEGFLNSIAKS